MTSTVLNDLSAAFAALVERAGASVASIRSGRWRSSGFIWKAGLIVTADETLADEDSAEVTLPGGDAAAAEIIGRDPATDVAVLRVARQDLPAAPLDAAPTRPGALVAVVGAREGLPLAALGATAFAGPPWSSLRGGRIDARIELDVRMPRAAEGGVVVDAQGRGLGMAVHGPRGRVLVIPAATIERTATLLETHGRIPRGYLGLALEAVHVEGGRRGLMVMRVDADGPAAKAGVLQGDVIVACDGRDIEGARGLLHALGPERVGQALTLSLRRAGAPIEVTVTVGERPSA